MIGEADIDCLLNKHGGSLLHVITTRMKQRIKRKRRPVLQISAICAPGHRAASGEHCKHILLIHRYPLVIKPLFLKRIKPDRSNLLSGLMYRFKSPTVKTGYLAQRMEECFRNVQCLMGYFCSKISYNDFISAIRSCNTFFASPKSIEVLG